MQTRKTQSSGAQLIRRRSMSKPSKEKLKSKEKPLLIRKSYTTRRLEPTKDVVPNFKKDKSKSSSSSTSKGSLGTLQLKAMKRDPYKLAKPTRQPQQQQRKQPHGIAQEAHIRRKMEGNAMAYIPRGPETGLARRHLKSQAPSPSSLITLTSRVKRREEKMKRSKELSWEADDRQSADTRKRPQKKAEDNYKEVFPEVKLEFEMPAQGSKSPEEYAPTQPSTLTSPFMTATTVSESPTKADQNLSKDSEAIRKSETPPPAPAVSTPQMAGNGRQAPQSTKYKHRYLPVHDPALLSLACTQRLSQMLTPTPQSQRSRLLSLKSYQAMPRSQFLAMPDRLPCTGLPCIRNKDNDGKLIINGTPFWVEDMPEDLTDEGNVLNAAVILDVVAGKLALVNMPDEQIILDIYGDWETLRSRDATCFNKDVLFGNTVRSMVNLFEGSMKAREARKIPETKFPHSLTTIDPTTIVYYMRDNLGYLTEVEFVASYKRKEPPKSCDI